MTSIEIKCDCGQIINVDLAKEEIDWGIVETDEREMGIERLHEAVLYIDCDSCKETITITLHIWEYPEGFYNMDEILVDGGELVKECSLDFLLFDEEEDDDEME